MGFVVLEAVALDKPSGCSFGLDLGEIKRSSGDSLLRKVRLGFQIGACHCTEVAPPRAERSAIGRAFICKKPNYHSSDYVGQTFYTRSRPSLCEDLRSFYPTDDRTSKRKF